MQEMHDAGNDEVKPDVVTFNSVINAWSKSGEKDAPIRAEALLQRMKDLAELTGDADVMPDVVSFNSAIDAWAKSGDTIAPHRAEQILQRMQDLHDEGLR